MRPMIGYFVELIALESINSLSVVVMVKRPWSIE